MKIVDSKLFESWQSIPEGEGVVSKQTRLEDVSSIYENVAGMDPSTLMYTVYSTTQGSLLWGQTIMEPVLVNGQCNMTRGHFHVRRDCDEYYWCQSGQGLLLLMDDQGQCWAEKMQPGSLHHISGQWAHRCINTGNEQLSVIACWPKNAGHDYNHSFSVQIFQFEDKISVKKV